MRRHRHKTSPDPAAVGDADVEQLLRRALDDGITPEEVCADHPELLPHVRSRIDEFHDMEAEVRALFPTRVPSPVPRDAGDPADEHLPTIPGYYVEGVLGRGGMGIVYRARQARLNREVALKMMLAGVYASPDELQRFLREAESAASLRSAHIVQVFEVGEQDGRPYFTMEIVAGGTLAEQMAGTPQLPRKAAALVALLARAVQRAHEGGIVHRDLKPGNILIAEDGTPKISDFGLAKRLGAGPGVTMSGARVGTPSYMAPEQVSGGPSASGRLVDVYALGAILYEMLTGRPPFRGRTPTETQLRVIRDEPVPPSRLQPRIPRDLETICLKCLQKPTERRYASAAELADDLDRFLRDEPIAARPVGRPERVVKWTRRHPARAVLAGAGALLLLVAAGAIVRTNLDRAVLARETRKDLDESRTQLHQAHLPEAHVALERAKGRLGEAASPTLRREMEEVDRDVELVAKLLDLRVRRLLLEWRDGNDEPVDREYEEAFQKSGIGSLGQDPVPVASRISASPARDMLLVALDDWLLCARVANRYEWVSEVARLADPDPAVRDIIRQPTTQVDAERLLALAASPEIMRQPVDVVLLLGIKMRSLGLDRSALLKRVLPEHAGDFFLQFDLGYALDDKDDPAAIECYQAALGIRPNMFAVLVNLGIDLSKRGRTIEAFDAFERALKLEPDSARAHENYAVALGVASRFEDSIPHAREAVRIDPKFAQAYGILCMSLWKTGRWAEARDAAQALIDLDPPDKRLLDSPKFIIRDCERRLALADRLPAVLAGTDAPADADESATFATMCFEQRHYREAAGLYARAFEASPQLVNDLRFPYLTDAAESAVRVGCNVEGAGKDVDEAERATWRARAREWVRGDIDLWLRALEVCDAEGRDELLRRVELLRKQPGLGVSRTTKGIEGLPPDERAEFARLWRDLDALQFRLEKLQFRVEKKQ